MADDLRHFSSKDMRTVAKAALKRGWRVQGRLGSGHIKLVHRNGQTAVTSGSKGEGRGPANFDAELRRLERQPTRKAAK